jgi:hypothetical protein
VKILLIGEAPATPEGCPFEGKSGERFEELAPGCLETTEATNLLPDVQPKAGKGRAFPAEAARAAAEAMDFGGAQVLLMAGRRVASAFGVPASAHYLEPLLVRGTVAYVIPHPSGVNRWFNEAENRGRFSAFFEALRAVQDGCEVPPGEFLAAARQAAGAPVPIPGYRGGVAHPTPLELSRLEADFQGSLRLLASQFAALDSALEADDVEGDDPESLEQSARVQEARCAIARAWACAQWSLHALDHGDASAHARYRDGTRAEMAAVGQWWVIQTPREVRGTYTRLLSAMRKYKRALAKAKLDDGLVAAECDGSVAILSGHLESGTLGNVTPITAARRWSS